MKLIEPYHPVEGQRGYKFVRWFRNNINWCEGYYYDTEIPKPENKLYNWFYKYWLFPYVQNDCMCCNTVRGLIYGAIIGFAIGVLL